MRAFCVATNTHVSVFPTLLFRRSLQTNICTQIQLRAHFPQIPPFTRFPPHTPQPRFNNALVPADNAPSPPNIVATQHDVHAKSPEVTTIPIPAFLKTVWSKLTRIGRKANGCCENCEYNNSDFELNCNAVGRLAEITNIRRDDSHGSNARETPHLEDSPRRKSGEYSKRVIWGIEKTNLPGG